MPWYGWLSWILLVVTVAGVIVYFATKKKPQTAEELQKKLNEMGQKLADSLMALESERTARKDTETQRAKVELAYLEAVHKEKLEELAEKERKEYEDAKVNPQSGVDYINSILGSGSNPG